MSGVWGDELDRVGSADRRNRAARPQGDRQRHRQASVRRAGTADHDGLAGDAQGDTRNYGGTDKAVHLYPADHYAAWNDEIGAAPLLTESGAFGENLTVPGIGEAAVAIGDRFRLGTALVEVSQGRQPCFRLNLRFGRTDMARRMQENGKTGWYFRVVEEGDVAPGDALVLVDRAAPERTIERIRGVFYIDRLDQESLSALAALAPLAAGWRELAAKRLATRTVEDWRPRLEGS
jgi:MOSC domain-containing protein YiiM